MKRPLSCLRLFLLLAAAVLIAAPAAAQFEEDPVTWSVSLSQSGGLPGDRVIVAVTADVTDTPDQAGKTWHFYPRAEEHTGVEVATTITPDLPWDIFHHGELQWPKPHMVLNAVGEMQPAYEGTQRFYLPVKIDRDAEPGIYAMSFEVTYMACASMCLPPKTVTLSAAFTVLEAGAEAPTSRAGEEAFSGFDPSGFDGVPSTLDEASGVDTTDETQQPADQATGTTVQPGQQGPQNIRGRLFGIEYDFDGTGPAAIILAILLAFVGGTVLNLMPCVLPIIPIKIMGLTQASDSRAKSTMLGAVMLLGVVFFWIALGLAIATVSGFDSVSSLFQRPLFGLGVGVFILVMAAGMMGAFTVGLPQWVYRINPKHDSPVGAFGFGIMAAVLSTPCTAPFMGAAVTWATQQASAFVTLAVFAAIGLGMGWPYMVLAAFPKLVEKVPRTGPASELVKQVLGLMLIATAVFFIGAGVIGLIYQRPYLGPVLHWWIIVIVVGMLAFWLAYRTFQITPSPARRTIFTSVGLLMFAITAYFAGTLTHGGYKLYVEHLAAEADIDEGDGNRALGVWAKYTPNRFAHAREDGRITIVEFTAVW